MRKMWPAALVVVEVLPQHKRGVAFAEGDRRRHSRRMILTNARVMRARDASRGLRDRKGLVPSR